jgi:hypothetical protein
MLTRKVLEKGGGSRSRIHERSGLVRTGLLPPGRRSRAHGGCLCRPAARCGGYRERRGPRPQGLAELDRLRLSRTGQEHGVGLGRRGRASGEWPPPRRPAAHRRSRRDGHVQAQPGTPPVKPAPESSCAARQRDSQARREARAAPRLRRETRGDRTFRMDRRGSLKGTQGAETSRDSPSFTRQTDSSVSLSTSCQSCSEPGWKTYSSGPS